MRRVEGSHDFTVLEARLFALIREAKGPDGAGPLAPVAIIVPTARAAAYLQVRLASEFGALLGVRVLHHHALAQEAAAAAGIRLPRELPRRVREAILARILEEEGGRLHEYVGARPGSLSAILATLDDLRDAEVDPAEAGALKGLSEGGREILNLHARHGSALDRLEKRGLSDRAGRRLLAASRIDAFARRFDLFIHYGAYEITGINLRLMKAIEEAGCDVVYLIPSDPAAPAFGYARRFAAEALGAEPAPIRPGVESADRPSALLRERLVHLYDEEAGPPEALPPEQVDLFHAQGPRAELREVATRILTLYRRTGRPLREFAVIARDLTPYAALLEPVLHDGFRIPFVTSAGLGALREARAQAALRLARAVVNDFERQPLLDLLRSGLYRGRSGKVPDEAHEWDQLSREFRVTRGRDAWVIDLPRWLKTWEPHLPADADEETRERTARWKRTRESQAASLARTVKELIQSAGDLGLLSAGRWDAWAEAMERLCRRHIDGFEEDEGTRPGPGAAAVLEVLAGMRLMGEARCPFGRAAALAHFESALAETSVPIGSVGGEESARDNGGVRVLDAMQARGLTFETVFLIGVNADLFPRRPREDPFLRDGDRRLLRERLERPVPLKSSGREEEHLLLAHMLGCARSRLVISWQRADESGRAKVPSLALREVARVARGSAELEAATAGARRIRTHPGECCRDAVAAHGFLPGPDALMGAALEIRSASKLREEIERLGSLLPADRAGLLDAGLATMDAVEAFAPADLSYDALVDDAAATPERWSPSRLETLGNCPQQYLFRHVLRVEELQEPAEAYETDLREIGERVHRILHGVYDRLIRSGDLSRPGADPKQAASRVMDLLNQAWAEETLDLAERMHGRYPVFWKTYSDLWKNALLTFLLYDIAEMQGGKVRLIGLEREASAAIDLGEGRELPLRGRFDRVVRGADGSLVLGDYKTGGNLERRVDLKSILKGLEMQMPLYALMGAELASSWGVEEGRARAEVIGVGPAHAQEAAAGEAGAHGYPARAGLDPERFSAIREGFTETLRVLVDLATSGFFPLREGSRCGYCPYDRACRRHHAPTVNRIASTPRAASFHLLTGKSTRAATLAEVTARGGGEEEA